MKVSDAFPSKYLSAADITDSITVTMSHTETTELEGKKKLVLFFKGAKKALMLNKTNASNIAKAYGDETEDWTGKPLVLFTAWVDYKGESVEAVRVRAPQPKDNPRQPQTPPKRMAEADAGAMDDEIPF